MRNVVFVLFAFCACGPLLANGKPKSYQTVAPPACFCRHCKSHHKHLAPAPPRAALVDSVAVRRVARPRGEARDLDRVEELEREVELLRQQLEKATALLLQMGLQQSRGCGTSGLKKPLPESQEPRQDADEDSGSY